ncbi:trehalose phosphatase, partial [Azospirillum sp. TSH58]
DAFRALAARGGGGGAGIRVMDPPAPSAAGWSLKDPTEAGAFLDRLAARLAEG